MKKAILVALLAIGSTTPARSAPPADLELWRLDCGRFVNYDMASLSDDDRYKGQKRDLADSCYLIRHGSEYMLWDAGLATTATGFTVGPKLSIVQQIAQIGVRPEQIKFLGLSHWHPDHIGQATDFARSKLLIGAADWEQLKTPPRWLNTAPLAPWMTGGSAVETVSRGDPVLSHDKDVFGDGTVVMIKTPGHTPGHHALLVRLKHKGVVLLSGDLYHQHESYDYSVVPSENQDRAATLASFDRFKRLAVRYKATVIVPHDMRDIAALPAFPSSAR